MNWLDTLSPPARQELLDLIDARIEQAFRLRRPERRWISVAECAKLLGISEKAVRGRIKRGRIPISHQGRSVVVDRVALDRMIEEAA